MLLMRQCIDDALRVVSQVVVGHNAASRQRKRTAVVHHLLAAYSLMHASTLLFVALWVVGTVSSFDPYFNVGHLS